MQPSHHQGEGAAVAWRRTSVAHFRRFAGTVQTMRVPKQLMVIVSMTITLCVLAAAPAAGAAPEGCAALGDPAQRADCTARAAASDRARAEVADRLRRGSEPEQHSGPRSAAWDKALAQASGVHLDE